MATTSDHISVFTGRETFLQTLRGLLQRDRVAVIAGASGMGKTATAREYVRRFAKHYRQVIWINADTAETLLADTVRSVQRLHVPINTQQDLTGIFQALQNWLNEQPDVLLVLDNATFLPMKQDTQTSQQARCHVLMISRTLSTPSIVPRLEMEPLNEQDGALLVLRRSDHHLANVALDHVTHEQRKAALELSRDLFGSPLALSLAGGYLHEAGCSMQEYISSYRNRCARLDQQQGSTDKATQVIKNTCHLALAHLKEAPPAALELLAMCAFLLPDAIPIALFQQQAAQAAFKSANNGQMSAPFVAALNIVSAHGLLTIQEETHTLSMPSQVQTHVRQTLPLDQQQQWVEQLLCTFQQLLPSIEAEALPIQLIVAGHIRHLAELSAEWSLAHNEAAEAFDWAAWLLWKQGLIREAEFLLSRALSIWERTLGHSHATVATALLNLATLNSLLQNYSLAENLSQRAVLTKSQALGIGHPDVLLSLDNLGHVYMQQDKLQDAKTCYQKALSIGDRFTLQNHPSYVASMYDLALLDIKQAAYSEAQPLLEKVCTVWDLSPDMDQGAVIRAWRHLGEVSMQLRDWAKMETCYRRILPTYEKALGKEHPETLHCQEEIANALLQQGKLAKAGESLRNLLRIREKTLGTGHPDVAACLHGLAKVALEQGQSADALSLIGRALTIYEHRPEPEDRTLAAVLDSLAIIYTLQAEYVRAIAALQRSLKIKERILGTEHLDLVENLSDLATLHLNLEQTDQADLLLLRSLAIYLHAQQPDDLGLDPVLNNLASIEMTRGHFAAARMYLERSQAIREQIMGKDDPGTAQVSLRLGIIAGVQEQWEQAETQYNRALTVYENKLGTTHPQTIDCLEQLAGLYAQLDRLAEAETALKRVLDAKQQTLGAGHPDLVEDLLTLGQLCLRQRQFAEAETYLRRILSAYKRIPKIAVMYIAQLADELITVLEEQGKNKQAATLSQEVQPCIAYMLR